MTGRRRASKRKAAEGSSKRRIITILIVGLPFILATYFYVLSQQPEESDPVVRECRKVVNWIGGLLDTSDAPVRVEVLPTPLPAEKDGVPVDRRMFSPGSAGNLAAMNENLELEGMNQTPEEHMESMRESFQDGQILLDE